jgi:hypothetical protein
LRFLGAAAVCDKFIRTGGGEFYRGKNLGKKVGAFLRFETAGE